MRQKSTYCVVLLLVLCRLLAAGQTAVLTVSPGSLSGFTTAAGMPSVQQSALVNGNGLTGIVTATAPPGFEISWTSGFNFGSSIVLTQSGGVVTNVPLYVRLTGAAVGAVSGTITITSAASPSQNVIVTGTVTAAPTPNPPCTFTGISPTSAAGGVFQLITIYGSNFVPGAVVGIYGINVITTTYISASQLTVLINTPSVSTPFTTYFGVGNPSPGGGNSAPRMIFFTVNPGPPTISSFTPTRGPVGTSVTINGTNLAPSSSSSNIFFNGTPAAPFPRVPSPTEIYAVVPPGATTGLITTTNGNGAAVSAIPFTVIASPPAFFEDFEAGTKTGYAAASVQLQSGGWTFGESLIGTSAGADKFNGTRSARLRGGGLVEMDVDKPNGAGVVTVSAAAYATETGASFVPEISTDGGVTYASLLGTGPAPTLTGTLTPYSFTANRTGNVRLRFSSTNTVAATNPRINIDDIGITDYRVGTATKPGQNLPELSVFPNPAQGRVTVQGAGAGPARCSLYDLAGHRLSSPVILAADGALNLPPNLPIGLYLLQIETPAGRYALRLATQ